jgi:cytochrome oxidase Cu insertion factor (SCO1/SenC/PrrC family)
MFAVAEQMHLTAVAKSENAPILHSDRFLLIDGDGNVRGVYDGNDPQKLQDLVDDAKFTARKHGGRW